METENQVVLDLNEIEFTEMEEHLILNENCPSLDFLDNDCATCGSESASFYCTIHDTYVCQRCRNKEHNPCINKRAIENIREFKQEIQFDVSDLHKEIKRFWLICQTIGISAFDNWVYDMSSNYENWIENLRKIAVKKDKNLIDKVFNNTDLKKMKAIHTEIQKAADWGSFSRSDLLYCLKLICENLGTIFENQMSQKKKVVKVEKKPNHLMESFRHGKLPEGAIQCESLPVLKREIDRMLKLVRTESVNLPNSNLLYRTVKLDNGETYQGQWTRDGKRHGIGSCVYPDGSFYQGFWENDQREGMGKYVTEKYIFEGNFKNDQICDLGLYKFSPTEIDFNGEEDPLDQKANFAVKPDIWNTVGHDYFVLQKSNQNEIIVSSMTDEMSQRISFTIDEDYGVEKIIMDVEEDSAERIKLVPKRKICWMF